MPTDCITYQNSGYFIPLMVDYLNQKPELNTLYNHFPSIENFELQIQEKHKNFLDASKRATLVSVLKSQYASIEISDLTKINIESLQTQNTFTITTGHQLNLFTGPLYFLYKIISTINLTKELKAKYPTYNFVPIYWMATEDHDFEEINYFNFKGKKFRWNAASGGAVGRLSTDGLEEVYEVFSKEIGSGINANAIKELFRKSYLEHNNLADATRFLANELFGEFGLVILDADDQNLKKEFVPYIKEELLRQTSYHKVSETIASLNEYAIQVNPREINLFYLDTNLRERIILENGIYKVNNTKITFSETEILQLAENHPEKFSPNVILRPLYQEVILPNLCYIGGGGEIAYWMELQSMFEAFKVTFPILLLRNSALLVTEKQHLKAEKLKLSWEDLFSKQTELLNNKVISFSEFPIDLSIQKEHLKNQFHYLHSLVHQTDKSFEGAVKAQEAKQLKGLENLERRLLKAQKRKHSEALERITDLQNQLFPNQGLQERQANFSEFYLENGKQIILELLRELKPLEHHFSIIIF